MRIRGQVQGKINAVLLRREPRCPRRSRSTRKWQKWKKWLKASHQTGWQRQAPPMGSSRARRGGDFPSLSWEEDAPKCGKLGYGFSFSFGQVVLYIRPISPSFLPLYFGPDSTVQCFVFLSLIPFSPATPYFRLRTANFFQLGGGPSGPKWRS